MNVQEVIDELTQLGNTFGFDNEVFRMDHKDAFLDQVKVTSISKADLSFSERRIVLE